MLTRVQPCNCHFIQQRAKIVVFDESPRIDGKSVPQIRDFIQR